MIAEYGIRATLQADPTIAGLVAARVYPVDAIPQAPTYPLITYQRISTVTEVTVDAQEAPERVRLQLNLLALSATAARALAMEVRRLFRGGYSTSGLQLAKLDGDGDLPREEDSKTFGVRIDLMLTMGAAEAA